jgi:hypothetical protein
VSKLQHSFKKMDEGRILCRSLAIDGVTVARLVPLNERFTFSPDPTVGSVRLSRSATLRRIGNRLVLESPLSDARLEVLDEAVMVALAALATPCEALPLTKIIGCSKADCEALLTLMANARALTAVDEQGDVEDRTSH